MAKPWFILYPQEGTNTSEGTALERLAGTSWDHGQGLAMYCTRKHQAPSTNRPGRWLGHPAWPLKANQWQLIQ